MSAAVMLVTITIIATMVWWLCTDQDLAAALAEARAQHIAIDASELALVRSSAERRALWSRIEVGHKGSPSYDSISYKIHAPVLKDFEPIPNQLRAHHAGLDAVKLTALLSDIDALGGERLILNDHLTFTGRMPEISIYRDLSRLLRERVALAGPDQLGLEARRMWTLIDTFDDHLLITHLVRTSLINIALGATVRRLDELKRSDPGLAARIERTAARLRTDLLDCLSGEFVAAVDCFEHSPPKSLGGGIFAGPPSWWDRATTPLVVRLGRRDLLEFEIGWITAVRAADSAEAMRRLCDERRQDADRKSLDPARILLKQIAPDYAMVVVMTLQTQIYAQLVIAELRGTAWPKDIFDPAGAAVRPIMRDGHVMGGYSLGPSGEDAGGKRPGNRYFPLYGPLDPPKPEVKPPAAR